MIKLIKSAKVYAPEYLGVKDVLISNNKIAKISDSINISGIDIKVIDAEGKYLVPGFIDTHVHICGGGGEGSYHTRTPEIMLTDITTAGVTTVIGTLGTDDVTRSMANLLAKAKGLNEEGVTVFVNTGSYHVPVKTLTGSIKSDLLLISEIIGVGEIALSDHRSMQPTFEEFSKLVAETRVAGMLSGKAGVVNVHIGDSKSMINIIEQIVETTEIPAKHFVPTHMNRNPYLFEKSLDYVSKGGFVDYTSSSITDENETTCSRGLKILYEKNLNTDNVTWSSDGQGSMPSFDENGKLIGLDVGKVKELHKEFKSAVLVENLPMEIALKPITKNPAHIYKLNGKGEIKEENHADLLLLDKDFNVDTVIAMGKIMIENKEIKVKGTFEK